MQDLKQTDPEIYQLIRHEERYELETIRLIPSENYVSKAVLEASGSVLTNKYSEGYPAKRYYEGQRYIDQIESIVIERAKALFGAEHANVQPYSGSPANLAVYFAPAEARRQDHGDGAAARGPSQPWLERKHHRTVLAGGAVHGRSRNPAYRLRRGARPGPARAPANNRGRRHRLPAPTGFPHLRRDRQRGRGILPCRHFTYLRPDSCRSPSRSGSLCRCRHDHGAQDPARPARRDDFVPPGSGRPHRPRSLPGLAGRPPQPHHRGDRRRAQGSRHPGLQGIRPSDRAQRQGDGGGADARAASTWCRAAPTTI